MSGMQVNSTAASAASSWQERSAPEASREQEDAAKAAVLFTCMPDMAGPPFAAGRTYFYLVYRHNAEKVKGAPEIFGAPSPCSDFR